MSLPLRGSIRLTVTLIVGSLRLVAGEHPTAEADRWIGLSTPHFELYAQGDSRSAMERLRGFETIYSFFAQAPLIRGVPGSLVRIIALSPDRESQAYMVNSAAAGYYQRTHSGDYIVIRDLGPENFELSAHEYAHLIIEHSGLKLPIWMNEGLADFYSSLHADHGQVRLGGAPLGRLETLQNEPWLDLETLFAVAHGSPYCSQLGKMRVFYAESWALTHMLALDSEYAPQFPAFLSMLSHGTSSRECFQLVYHKSPEQAIADLRRHLFRKELASEVLEMDLTAAPGIEPKSMGSPQEQAELSLADLAAFNGRSPVDGETQLRSLSNKYPGSPGAEESLGYLALAQNRPADARVHFTKAIDRHSTSSEVLFYLAQLLQASGGRDEQAVDLLNRALAMDPGSDRARIELGCLEAKANHFELAVSTLSSMGAVKPEHGYLVSFTLAYSYAQLDQNEEARSYGEKARGLATGLGEQKQAKDLLRYIDDREPERRITARAAR